MWNIFCVRMFGTDAGHTSVRGLAGLGQSIIAAVEVFAFLYVSDLRAS